MLLYEEVWLPDLAYHLRGDEARPVTRLFHGTYFALSMLASAHRSSRNLSSAAPHPEERIVLPPGLEFHAAVSGNQVSLTGESDMATWKSLSDSLLALGRLPATELVLDMTGLSFADSHTLDTVVRFAATLTPPQQLEVRCSGRHGYWLRRWGGDSISQLSIIITRLCPSVSIGLTASGRLDGHVRVRLDGWCPVQCSQGGCDIRVCHGLATARLRRRAAPVTAH